MGHRGVHFPLPSLDLWHVQYLQGSDKQSSTTGPESQNALHGLQLFSGENSKIQVWGSSKRTGLPIVSLYLIWSVQLLSLQAKANHKYSPYEHLHSGFFGFWGFFFMLVEQHQPNTGETEPFPTLHASNLFDSCLYLRYHKKKRELCYSVYVYCVP